MIQYMNFVDGVDDTLNTDYSLYWIMILYGKMWTDYAKILTVRYDKGMFFYIKYSSNFEPASHNCVKIAPNFSQFGAILFAMASANFLNLICNMKQNEKVKSTVSKT